MQDAGWHLLGKCALKPCRPLMIGICVLNATTSTGMTGIGKHLLQHHGSNVTAVPVGRRHAQVIQVGCCLCLANASCLGRARAASVTMPRAYMPTIELWSPQKAATGNPRSFSSAAMLDSSLQRQQLVCNLHRNPHSASMTGSTSRL